MDIKAGDLVMVVKPTPCCGNTDSVGKTFVVSSITLEFGCCRYCGAWFLDDAARSGEMLHGVHWQVLPSRLIRIDPLSEPETVIEEAVA